MGSRVKRKKASRTRPAASGDSRTRNDRLIASAICILLAGIRLDRIRPNAAPLTPIQE